MLQDCSICNYKYHNIHDIIMKNDRLYPASTSYIKYTLCKLLLNHFYLIIFFVTEKCFL